MLEKWVTNYTFRYVPIWDDCMYTQFVCDDEGRHFTTSYNQHKKYNQI